MRRILLGLIVGVVLVFGLASAQGGESPADVITETVPPPVPSGPTAAPGTTVHLGGKCHNPTSEASYPPAPPVIVPPPTPEPGDNPPAPTEVGRPI